MSKNTGFGFTAESCKVIHKESAGSIIVKKADGTTESISTGMPGVGKGTEGKIVELDGKRIFLRRPYKD